MQHLTISLLLIQEYGKFSIKQVDIINVLFRSTNCLKPLIYTNYNFIIISYI